MPCTTHYMRWKKSPMIQGKLYCCLASNRELLSDKDMFEFFNSDYDTSGNSWIKANDNVIYLDNVVMEYIGADGKSYQSFIKVLTPDGAVGWVIWFKDEWEKVETNVSIIL